MIDPNYFFGYVFNLDSKEKLISIDIDKNAIGIEDTYNSLDFINWIYKLENSNLTKIFEMILEQTDYQKTTFWEKIITNHNRKYELLKLYLEMNFEENTNNNSFWKFKQKFIESLQLDYHWRLEDGKEL
ncbi:hypothetical protein [Mycoplasmopsis glycophila]|uniref:Uncharacterized protein n=1 Tax=Mycoplasmopsis glycophila TaxID=171285 RepID=A0A449AV41_9BACT|nr:hypothetical protein [Mycoplasmopsis glycophila]VEU70340.1 Uncharacterised protein [Mycoplasmopsis glycophila]